MFSEDFKYLCLMALVGSFFTVELVVGYVADSIVLQTDAFHMLSDFLAIIIAYTSYRLTFRSKSYKYTYGLVRSEVVGGLINSVFLLSTCFFLILEIIHKITELVNNGGNNPTLEKEIDLVLIVGSMGLGVNIIGLLLFHQAHHGHSHEHSNSNNNSLKKSIQEIDDSLEEIEEEIEKETFKTEKEIINHNKKALLLHIFGDFLGSIVVIITSLVIKYGGTGNWRFYLDPLASCLVIIIICYSSYNILRYVIQILLHQSPSEINVRQLLSDILELPSITNIHEFHLWSLTDAIVKASFHVNMTTDSIGDSDQVLTNIKDILHQYGIHSSSIQPEWSTTNHCLEPNCRENCHQYQCCSFSVKTQNQTETETQNDINIIKHI